MKSVVKICWIVAVIIGFAFSGNASAKEIEVIMVLWRGITEAEKGFEDRLKELGYKPHFVILDADQNRSEIAGKLRKELAPRLEEIDYVYSFGTTASQMVKQLNHGIAPHIFNIVTDPVRANVADSMDSAGKNISGVSHKISLSMQIEIALQLKEIKTLGFFFNPREKNSNVIGRELESITKKHNISLIKFRSPPARNMLEKNLKLLELQGDKIDAVYFPLDSYLVSNSNLLGARLKAAKIMSIGAQKEYISNGVLMGLVPDYYKLGKMAADILDRHQNGEKLQDIPVMTENSPRIMINEPTRKVLEIKVPETVFENAILFK